MTEGSEGSAAEQLRALVEAAEKIRADAERDAARARAAVARVGERAEDLERRLDELAAGVGAAVAALKEEVAALRAAPAPPPADDPGTRVDPAADDELIATAEAAAARKPEPQPGEPAAPEGARLLALKMALDGRPREETASYLSENFQLDNPEALLDEVYARAGG
jgi:hypothetical protein